MEAATPSSKPAPTATARPKSRLLARPHPGSEGHARLGARIRRGRHPPGRRRVGRARGDPVAGHPGGRQDRPLRLRVARPVLRRPDRPVAADRQRGAVLGRRRHRHGDHGHDPRGRRDLRQRHARAVVEWVPQCFGDRRRRQGRRVLRRPSPTPAPTSPRMRTTASLRRGHRRVGAQRRRRRGRPTAASPTSTSSSPRSTRRSAPAARPRSSSRPAPRASSRARRSRSTACAPRTPPTSSSTTSASPARCLLGGKEKLDERLARAREGKALTRPGRDADLRAHPPDGRRPGARHRPRRLRVRAGLRQGARRSSAARSSRTRRSPSRWPT